MSVNGTMVGQVEELIKIHGQNLVLCALDETILSSGRSLRYTCSILNRWQSQGLKTIEQVKQSQATYEASKHPQQSEPTSFEDWTPTEENPF